MAPVSVEEGCERYRLEYGRLPSEAEQPKETDEERTARRVREYKLSQGLTDEAPAPGEQFDWRPRSWG
jgi:hypothetical protein